jgi:hypothetical protein
VKDRIWVAKKHLEYEDTEKVLPDLVPIYTGLDELVSYVATAKAKGRLDQAKQVLAFARIDHRYAKDDAAAKVDLAAAKGYLDAAAGKSGPEVKAKIEAVSTLVQELETGVASHKGGSAAEFQQAEAQLASMIRQL